MDSSTSSLEMSDHQFLEFIFIEHSCCFSDDSVSSQLIQRFRQPLFVGLVEIVHDLTSFCQQGPDFACRAPFSFVFGPTFVIKLALRLFSERQGYP